MLTCILEEEHLLIPAPIPNNSSLARARARRGACPSRSRCPHWCLHRCVPMSHGKARSTRHALMVPIPQGHHLHSTFLWRPSCRQTQQCQHRYQTWPLQRQTGKRPRTLAHRKCVPRHAEYTASLDPNNGETLERVTSDNGIKHPRFWVLRSPWWIARTRPTRSRGHRTTGLPAGEDRGGEALDVAEAPDLPLDGLYERVCPLEVGVRGPVAGVVRDLDPALPYDPDNRASCCSRAARPRPGSSGACAR